MLFGVKELLSFSAVMVGVLSYSILVPRCSIVQCTLYCFIMGCVEYHKLKVFEFFVETFWEERIFCIFVKHEKKYITSQCEI